MERQTAQNSSPRHSESSTDGIDTWTFLDEPTTTTTPNTPVQPLRLATDQTDSNVHQTDVKVRPTAAHAVANDDSWDDVSDTGSEAETDADDEALLAKTRKACSSVEELSDNEDHQCDSNVCDNKTDNTDETGTLRSRNVEHKKMISRLQQVADIHQRSSVEHKAMLSINQPSDHTSRAKRPQAVCTPFSVGGLIILFFMLSLFLVRTMKVQVRDNELKSLHDEIDRWSTMAIRTAAQVDRLQNLVNLHDVQYNEIESKKFLDKFAPDKGEQKHVEEEPEVRPTPTHQVVYHRRPEQSWNPIDSISDYFRETPDLDKNIRRSQQENLRRLHEAKSSSSHPDKFKHHDERSKSYKFNRH